MVKFFVFCSIFFVLFIPSAISQTNPIYLLKEGKKALDSHNYEKAIDCFSKALPELREIGDYILLWRAKAYKAINRYKEGLEDIQTLLKTYPKSPLTREAKRVEIEFIKKSDNEEEIESIYEKFILSYPEDLEIKLEYAQFLKNREKAEKAKIYLKEIFLTSSSLADIAEKLLDKSDITVNDLIKKAQNLINSYYFKKAENYLLKALNNSSLRQKKEIYSLLGYSLFMQKKYTEAAEAFKKSNDIYWLARSYLRAKDYESFEKIIPKLIQSSEVEIGSLLTNYANIKRRTGDVQGALNILKTVLNKYPTLEEDIMWSTGWILYSSKKFDEAQRIFKNLYQNYKKIKYLYWYIRAANKKGVINIEDYSVTFLPGDYYSYLLYKYGVIASVPIPSKKTNFNSKIPLRVELLIKAKLKEEALKELKWIINNNRDLENIPVYAKLLNILGDYSTSLRLISKLPDKFSYHEFLYPKPYFEEVMKVSKKFAIDPYLILAVMREESRFDRTAVSVAGACGLMQLMFDTAVRESKKIEVSITSMEDLFNPSKNITVGVAYLKKLINEFQSIPIALAAYNAGENNVRLWLNDKYEIDEFIEDIPFNETKNYVKRVLTSYAEYLRTKELTNNFIKIITYKKEEDR